MWFDIFVQGLGYLGLLATIIAVQFNKHYKIMIFKSLSELLFAIQLIFLASYTGAAMNFISVIRNVIFVYAVRKNKPILPWIIAFSIFAIATGVTTSVLSWNSTVANMQARYGDNIFSLILVIFVIILPMAAKVTTTFAYACKDPHKLRMINLPSIISWLLHDIIIFTLAGMSNNIFAIISIIVAEIRYKKILANADNSTVSIENSENKL